MEKVRHLPNAYMGMAANWAAADPVQPETLMKTQAPAARTPAQRMDSFSACAAAKAKTPSPEEEAQALADRIAETVDALEKSYPGLQISGGDLSGKDGIRDYAVSAGPGMHLVLSSKFLKWMASSSDAFTKGVRLIGDTLKDLALRANTSAAQGNTLVNCGAYIGEDGEAAYWTATGKTPEETQKEDPWYVYQETLRKGLEKMVPKKQQTMPFSPGREAAQLAAIDTPEGARMIMGRVCGYIFTLRSSSFMYESAGVNKTINQLERILGSAAAKAKNLENELIMKKMQKKAAEARMQRKAEEIKAELKQAQSKRRSKEYALANEFSPMPVVLTLRKERRSYEDEARALAEIAAELNIAMPDCAAFTGAGTVEAAGVTFTDVAVTDVVISQSVDVAV